MIFKRGALQLGLMALLLIMFVPAHAKVLKIATLSPDGTMWMKEMRAGAAEIKERTQGRVTIKFYPGGVMGSDSNILRKMHIGQLHGGAFPTGALTGIDPDIDIYGLPFIFSSLEQVDFVRNKMDETLVRGLAQNGLVSFGFAEAGFAYMMSGKPLRTVDDVRQQKVWGPSGDQVGEAVFSSAGVSPVILPLSDVLTGLQTGLVNTVVISPIGAIALQWHSRVKYVIDVPIAYLAATLVIDKKAFEKLKMEDQKIVNETMTAAFKRIDSRNRKDNIAAREALKNQGLEFITLSAEARSDWQGIADKALQLLEEKNDYSDEIYDQIRELVKEAKKVHP